MADPSSMVYLIDDDASIRDAVSSLLRSVGFHAEVFATTQEFKNLIRAEVPSCLVLDVKLPGVSGLEFHEELKNAGIQIPTIFITAHGDIPMTSRAMKAGAIEFLAKPFQKQDLLAAIRQALDLDRARREKPEPEDSGIGFINKVASRMSAATPLDEVLEEVVEFVTSVVKCDSCLVYVLQKDELVLKASKNPHPELVDRLKLRLGQGITGWVAEHLAPVAVTRNAWEDPRFKLFNELPEDRFEAFLSVPMVSGGRLVGVINVQDRAEHEFSPREISLIATAGYLVGAEVERARLETENSELSDKLETRKIVERAKGILQRDLKVREEEAYRMLQRESQQRRKTMKEMAEAVIFSDELKRRAQ